MEIKAYHGSLAKLSTPALFIPVFEDETKLDAYASALVNGAVPRLIESGSITGKFKEFSILYPENGQAGSLILIGAGKRNDFTPDRLRSLVAKASRIARRMKAKELAVPAGSLLSLDPEESGFAAAEGAILGLYRFDKYKNGKPAGEKPEEKLPAVLTVAVADANEAKSAEKGIEKAKIIAAATNFTRDLVNEPSNMLTPTTFAAHAKTVAKERGLEIEVFEKSDIEKLGMGGLLCVAKGSAEPPKLVVLKYKGAPGNSFTLGLVGKGVTFDSGGISIKPADNMQAMTCDMAGAAACLGAINAIAGLKLSINVTAVLPLAENLPGGNAYKPGDIVKTYAGKTVEIINTDAEGRMLLCDALAYSRTLGVSAVIDIATLTGAVMTALASAASGIFSNDEKLLGAVMEAGEKVGERYWNLPLFPAYTTMMKGSLADLKNAGGKYGGACTAAAFLKEFVGDTPWAHLDIAGTALMEDKTPYQERPYLPKSGATGVGVRTLAFLAESLSRKKGL